MTRGIIRFFIALIFCAICAPSFAYERVGIISDAVLTKITPYNAYFKTPEFFLQDVRGELVRSGMSVVSVDTLKNSLSKTNIKQNDIEALVALQQGYDLDYATLKKVAKAIGVKKIVVITSAIDIQRDFLKNTLWNVANIQGMDVVNPTHRVSVYVAFVDVENEIVLWEQIYAKNIRNNKFKNLDSTISNNYEGMLRLKEYSKYISPEIAYQVKSRTINPKFETPPEVINKANTGKYFKNMKNIGSKKRLTDINKDKWDSEKFKKDSKANFDNKIEKIKKKFKQEQL